MPKFGPRSLERLATCHPDLQRVMREAIIDGPDFTILCGHRGEAEQNDAVAKGLSKAPWPTSKHNSLPSRAVDIAPYPIDWNDRARFKHLAEHVFSVAAGLGIRLRWGGDFNMDGDKTTNDAWDLPHFELKG